MNKKNFIVIVSIGIVLIASRLSLLHLLPVTLTHDELVYATQAYSYTVQGTSLDQKNTPLTVTPNDPMYAELPATVLLPGFYLSTNTLVASHIVPTLLGIILPLALAWLVYGLWKDKIVSIAVLVLTTFNPLFLQLSRMSYDAYFSVVFYIIGAALLVTGKRWWKLFSLLFFFFGFFQYQGFKLILIPFVLLIIVLNGFKLSSVFEKKTAKSLIPEYIVVSVLIGLTFFYGLFLLPGQNTNNRLSRTIFTDSKYLAARVDLDRKLSINSPFATIFSNKLTKQVDFVVDRTIQTFNPTLLFQIIPPANHGYLLWTHGIFYLFEGICILLGVYLLFANPKMRFQGTFLLLGVFFLNLTNMINTDSGWSLLRALMSYVLLFIIGSFGLAHILRLKNKLLLFGLVGIYMMNIISFSYQYMYRYPVMSADMGNFDERIIAKYISLHQKENPQVPLAVYTEEPWYYLYSYLLYSKSLNLDNANSIAKQLQEYRLKERQVYRVGNISFANTCIPQEKIGTYIGNIKQTTCINDTDNIEIALFGKRQATITKPANALSTISSVQDSGVKYRIYNDSVCNGQTLQSFIHLTNFKQLSIEDLPVSEFCPNWITNGKE